MTEALERVLKQAEQLPEEAQLELARTIEQKLSDMRWDLLLQRPETATFLRDLEREAEDESALEDLGKAL